MNELRVRPFASLHLSGARQAKTSFSITKANRAIVGVDVEGSTELADAEKTTLRQELYKLLELSLWRSGLDRDALVDRGDGALILLHTSAQAVLDTFISNLGVFLGRHNARNPKKGFRLRMAVHVGQVRYDQRAPYGEAVDLTCRLLDAPELKRRLRRTTGSFVLAVSDPVHRCVPERDRRLFTSLAWLRIGRTWHEAWVYAS